MEYQKYTRIKKLTAILVLAFFLLLALISPFALLRSGPAHLCTGRECVVCRAIQCCTAFLHIAAAAVIAAFLLLRRLDSPKPLITPLALPAASTPVSMMIRLNN